MIKAENFVFSKQNYIMMGTGIAIMIVGYFLMSGGTTTDPTQFNADDVYSFRRITLAPIVVLSGIVVVAFSILKKTK